MNFDYCATLNMTPRPNDNDIDTMNEYVRQMTAPHGIILTKCLLLGRHCSDVHIIEVAPLNDTTLPYTHKDLNFYAWSAGIPHFADNFVNLGSNRVILNFKKLGKPERYTADYVVVHYDQSDTALYLTYEKKNKALSEIVKEKRMIWHGDIFVVKKDANGDDLMDMVTEDIEDVVELLKEAVLSSRIY